MRTSAIVTAAFAATALAVPLLAKRDEVVDIVTDIDITYVTDIITVTAGEPAPSAVSHGDYGHNSWHHHYHHHHPSAPAPIMSTETATAAPPPTHHSTHVPPPPPTSKAAPPPPPPSSISLAPTSTYVPPSSSSPPPPPTSTQAPVSGQNPVLTDAAALATCTGGAVGSPQYTQALLDQHNAHRLNHSAPTLTYNARLASIASEIAASCTYAHNTAAGGGGYGQNIAAGTTPDEVGQVITNEMYNGEIGNFEGLYGQANPTTNFDGWGHFSQIVWKSTTSFGCWTQQCKSLVYPGMNPQPTDIPPYFTVCNYDPPGNFEGEYAENIAEPLGHQGFSVD